MTHSQTPLTPPPGWPRPAHAPNAPAEKPILNRWTALIAVVTVTVVAAVGALFIHHALTKPAAGELTLTAATDPGPNAFMPSAASPPPSDTQPPPTLEAQGQADAVETQPLPGDREGLYGGTVNTTEVDRDKIIDFLRGHPAQANAFVESLNVDNTVYWSGGRALAVADIPQYLHELTPALLRLDTRITNHGFDGIHRTNVQSVFQSGTAVLVDAHGVPRVHGSSGNPLTAPIPLLGRPKLVGEPWSGFRPGALAEVNPSKNLTKLVLVDVVTGKPFNRPLGTSGSEDTPHNEPVREPRPEPSKNTQPKNARESDKSFAGSYRFHYLSSVCGGYTQTPWPDGNLTITQNGNTIHIDVGGPGGISGPLNPDGSFVATGTFPDQGYSYTHTWKGTFAVEASQTVIRNGEWTADGSAMGPQGCHDTYTAVRQ